MRTDIRCTFADHEVQKIKGNGLVYLWAGWFLLFLYRVKKRNTGIPVTKDCLTNDNKTSIQLVLLIKFVIFVSVI